MKKTVQKYTKESPFHWGMSTDDHNPSPTACGKFASPADVLWKASSILAYQGPLTMCNKCIQIAFYFDVEFWIDIPNQPTNQATQQPSLSSSSNPNFSIHRLADGSIAKTGSIETIPPSSISRPFTPEEFLSWLRWNETHGDLSLGEIITEAEYMFGFRDARPDLAC